MAINKVSFYGDTLLDISDTTADESSVVKGKVFIRLMGLVQLVLRTISLKSSPRS